MIYSLREWQTLEKDTSKFIIQASTKDGLDGWTDFPIGMSWGWLSNQNVPLIGDHSETVLCAISTTTDSNRRKNEAVTRFKIAETLYRNGIQNIQLNHSDYFKTLSSYKFVISPEGNGIDCHRHYESLLAGCIPIVERNPLTDKKYEGCPILWTTDYSEITIDYLSKKYDEMIDIQYDFSKLWLDTYPLETQTVIHENSIHWITYFNKPRVRANKLLPFLKI